MITFTLYHTGIYVSSCGRYIVCPTVDGYWRPICTVGEARPVGRPQALKEDAMRLCQDHADMSDLPL